MPVPPGTTDCPTGKAEETEPDTKWVAELCLDADAEVSEVANDYLDEHEAAGYSERRSGSFEQQLQTFATNGERQIFFRISQMPNADWGVTVIVEPSD